MTTDKSDAQQSFVVRRHDERIHLTPKGLSEMEIGRLSVFYDVSLRCVRSSCLKMHIS